MNTHFLSIALLLNISSISMLSAHNDEPALCRCPTIHTIFSSPHTFTVQTHLTVTPTNYEQWEVADLGGLELVSYEFKRSELVGSVGTQTWLLRAPKAGIYLVTFSRNDETKVISIDARRDIAWCGKREPMKPIEF